MEWPYENLVSFNGKDIDEILSLSTGEGKQNDGELVTDLSDHTISREESSLEALTNFSKSYLQELLIQKECELIVLKLQFQAFEGRCECSAKRFGAFVLPFTDKKEKLYSWHSNTGSMDSLEEPQWNTQHSKCISCHSREQRTKKLALDFSCQINEFENSVPINTAKLCLDDFISGSQQLVTINGVIESFMSGGTDQVKNLSRGVGKEAANSNFAMEYSSLIVDSSLNYSLNERDSRTDNSAKICVSQVSQDNCDLASGGCQRCQQAGFLVMKMSNVLSTLYQKCQELQVEKRTYRYATKVLRKQLETMEAREVKLQARNLSQYATT